MWTSVLWTSLIVFGLAGGAGAGRDKHGALAYNAEDGSYGWAVDADTQNQADRAARRECGDCQIVMQFKNTCAAFATGKRGAYGWAYAPTKKAAQSKALGYCSEHGGGCSIKVWACTSH